MLRENEILRFCFRVSGDLGSIENHLAFQTIQRDGMLTDKSQIGIWK